MPTADAIRWFKDQFHHTVSQALQGTPFDVDMLTAIACQETGYIWNALRKKGMAVDRILALCVGDTIDAPNRKAFPRTKAELLARPSGDRMFAIARQALLDMAPHVKGYESAAANQNKFCRGFGVFQYDLQHFGIDPDHFLAKRYERFDASLAKAVEELRAAMKRIGWSGKTSLNDMEMAAVAIAYNAGTYVPSKGLKQGHQNKQTGRFYGEELFDFLRLSRTVPPPGGTAVLVAAAPGLAPLPAPLPVTAASGDYNARTLASVLNVRSTPEIPADKPNRNVVATLPEGHPVRALSDKKRNGFLEIETSLHGALIRGFAAAKYLSPAAAPQEVPVLQPAAQPPASGITAVYMPRKEGTITRRTGEANAHTLNEKGAPARQGATAAERRAGLDAIVDWLDAENPKHLRYWPRAGLTFCNVYAHDYCHLAGCYLPRVWWTQPAIAELAQGGKLEPLSGNTVLEVRANDLYRWLHDFGLAFGWRRAASLDELQLEVNQGAVGLIVARRKHDGKSGHIVAVVPEGGEWRARRDASGRVVAPLQSQAGAGNFRRGTGKTDWFRDEQFAEFAFWLHA